MPAYPSLPVDHDFGPDTSFHEPFLGSAGPSFVAAEERLKIRVRATGRVWEGGRLTIVSSGTHVTGGGSLQPINTLAWSPAEGPPVPVAPPDWVASLRRK